MPSACSNKKNNKKNNNKGSSNAKKATDSIPVGGQETVPETIVVSSSDQVQTVSGDDVTVAATANAADAQVNNNSAQISKAAAAGFTEEDVDDELPVVKAQSSTKDNDNEGVQNNGENTENDGSEQEQFVFVQDPSFNVKIVVPGLESFEIEVSFFFFFFFPGNFLLQFFFSLVSNVGFSFCKGFTNGNGSRNCSSIGR